MVSASASVSFYDFLNKIVIGFLLIYPFRDFAKSAADCCCQTLPDVISIFCFLIASFISGLIFSYMINCITHSLTNNKKLIQRARLHVIDETYLGVDLNESLTVKGNYYYYYYKLMRSGMLRNIPILEALENFSRQLFFVNIIYVLNTSTSVY